MTDEQILKESIEKAKNDGWKIFKEKANKKTWKDIIKYKQYFNLIFSQDFAKAFWGEIPLYCSACDRTHRTKSDCDAGFGYKDLLAWEFHLRNMVLSKEPLKYLENFI